MLGCCWAIIGDVGPTLKLHWLTVEVGNDDEIMAQHFVLWANLNK